ARCAIGARAARLLVLHRAATAAAPLAARLPGDPALALAAALAARGARAVAGAVAGAVALAVRAARGAGALAGALAGTGAAARAGARALAGAATLHLDRALALALRGALSVDVAALAGHLDGAGIDVDLALG